MQFQDPAPDPASRAVDGNPLVLPPAILRLKPEDLWRYFAGISCIPRPSGREDGVRAYLRKYANANGFGILQDACGNVVIKVPGLGNGVSAKPLVLQAHMDMVCVPGANDLLNSPAHYGVVLKTDSQEVDGEMQDVVRADNTSLGADNGIGLAAALAVVTDPEIKNRPPIEILLTVQEEVGLIGAKNLDVAMLELEGKRMLNLDNGDGPAAICVSCAGGRDMEIKWDAERVEPESGHVPIRLVLTGLPGGHSGEDIDKDRGNAIIFLARALQNLGTSAKLASLTGGTARNAIPAEAEAIIWWPTDGQTGLGGLNALIDMQAQDLRREVPPEYQKFRLVAEVPRECDVPNPFSREISQAIIRAIAGLQNGVEKKSLDVPGLVETSSNLGVACTEGNIVTLTIMSRSSKPGAIEELQGRIEARVGAAGASVTYAEPYPGWEARETSLRARVRERIEATLGVEPREFGIHAGLECAVFAEKIPGVEIVSIGPRTVDNHSVNERVSIQSVQDFWRCLKVLVEGLCEEG